jgi:hypothetical protein
VATLGGAVLTVLGSGGNGSSATTGVWASLDAGASWSLRGAGPPPRTGACVAALSGGAGLLAVAGGLQRLRGARVAYLSDVWVSAVGGVSWASTPQLAAPYTARAGAACWRCSRRRESG